MKKKILKILWHCLFNRSSGRPYTLASVSTLILWLHFMHTLVFTDSILPQFFLSVHLYCNGDHITLTTNAGSVIFFSFFIIQSLYVSLYICTVHFSSFYFISEWNFTLLYFTDNFIFTLPDFDCLYAVSIHISYGQRAYEAGPKDGPPPLVCCTITVKRKTVSTIQKYVFRFQSHLGSI